MQPQPAWLLKQAADALNLALACLEVPSQHYLVPGFLVRALKGVCLASLSSAPGFEPSWVLDRGDRVLGLNALLAKVQTTEFLAERSQLRLTPYQKRQTELLVAHRNKIEHFDSSVLALDLEPCFRTAITILQWFEKEASVFDGDLLKPERNQIAAALSQFSALLD